MRFTNVDVFARDNSVMALNLPQAGPIPVQTKCGTLITRPLNLPVGYVHQTYGQPVRSFTQNGLQYWLYNALGILLTVPVGGAYVQGLTVYPVGEYCTLVPMFVSFGGFNVNVGSALQCPADGGHEHEGPSR
jgi:hypothetical protein